MKNRARSYRLGFSTAGACSDAVVVDVVVAVAATGVGSTLRLLTEAIGKATASVCIKRTLDGCTSDFDATDAGVPKPMAAERGLSESTAVCLFRANIT